MEQLTSVNRRSDRTGRSASALAAAPIWMDACTTRGVPLPCLPVWLCVAPMRAGLSIAIMLAFFGCAERAPSPEPTEPLPAAVAAPVVEAVKRAPSSLALPAKAQRERRAVPVAKREPRIRLVTLGPGLTEAVFSLGHGPSVVGTDDGSTYPPDTGMTAKLGDQRAVTTKGISALRPNLVLASASAGPQAALKAVEASGITVAVMPAVQDVAGAKKRIEMLGGLLGVEQRARDVIGKIDTDIAAVTKPAKPPRVVFLVNRKEGGLHIAGAETGIDELIRLAGAENAVTTKGFIPITESLVASAAPDVILVTTQDLSALGGVNGLRKVSGVDSSPAAQRGAFVHMDAAKLLSFGPRVGEAVLELSVRLALQN